MTEQKKLPTSQTILFFFPQNPYPPRSGAHVRCLEILSGLTKLNYNVIFLYANRYSENREDTETAEYLKKTGVREVFFFQGSFFEYLLSALIRRVYLLCNRIPPPGSYKYTPKRMRTWFKRLQTQFSPEIIWMNYSNNDSLVDRHSIRATKHVIDYHDLVSVNHRMLIAVKRCFSRRRPFKVMDTAILDEHFFSDRSFPLDPRELEVLMKYDVIVAISPNEAEMLRQFCRDKTVIYLPVTFPAAYLENSYTGPALFATGPNAFNLQGFFYFTEKVLPNIQKHVHDFKLDVSGSVSEEVRTVPGITLRGFVEDLRHYYGTARFAICPVLGGTGQQIKIVEAMAYGLPVVVTRFSARTSPIVHGQTGFVAEDAQEFAEYCILLWQDPNLCRKIGEAARETIREKYSEDLLQKKLSEVVK
jgi:hypothetical protein